MEEDKVYATVCVISHKSVDIFQLSANDLIVRDLLAMKKIISIRN